MVELLPSTWPFLPHSFPIPSSHGVALPGYPGAQFLQKGCWLPEAVETPGAGLASGRWVSGWPCGWWLWLHQWWQPWCLTTWWIDTPPVFAGVSEGSPEMEGIDTQLAELGIGGGTMTPAQKAELASVLAGIEEMKIRPNSTCIPFFLAWACYQIKFLIFVSQRGRITCATRPSQAPCFNRGFQAWNVPWRMLITGLACKWGGLESCCLLHSTLSL